MSEWYDAWAAAYAERFALTDAMLAAVLSWRDDLVGRGATPDRLAEVLRRLTADPPGDQFGAPAAAHLRAVSRHLGDLLRAELDADRRREEADPASGWACVTCDGNGVVIVPYVRDVKSGVWHPDRVTPTGRPVRRTCAVACGCAKGQRTVAAAEAAGRVPLLTLAAYERDVCPTWREQVRAAEQADAESHRAACNAQAVPGPARAVVGRLAAGMGLPGS